MVTFSNGSCMRPSILRLITLGQDSAAYLERLQKLGISTANILIKADSYNAQCFVTADADNNQINAFHPGAMAFAHENPIANAGPARVAIISPDGDLGMLKHAADLAELGIPFMFDPGQQLPRFDGAQLPQALQPLWQACTKKTLDIGYNSGVTPGCVSH